LSASAICGSASWASENWVCMTIPAFAPGHMRSVTPPPTSGQGLAHHSGRTPV
jgi:hypothetical protein